MKFLQMAFDWLEEQTKVSNQENTQSKAERQIVLCNQMVSYRFERSKRRTIGFLVGKEGLTVRAPRWTPFYEVEAAIVEKSRWILKQLHAMQERAMHSAQLATSWQNGQTVDYLGEPYQISLGAMVTTIDTEQKRIWIALPSTANEAQIQDAGQAAIGRAAKLLFETRLNHYAPLLHVHWTKLKLSNATGRWGTAKSDGTIHLNWRLMHYRLPVIDYVVVHELSHLRHMDHSPRFWDTVESIMPNYETLKRELKP